MAGNIQPVEIQIVIRVIESIIKDLLTLPDYPKNRDSGYLTIIRKSDGRVLLVTQIGECPAEKAQIYFALSQEKGFRLLKRPGDVSSWQSRDEAQEKYGGAIVAGDFILSFSGLPELADEFVSLKLALFFTWITEREALQIVKISQNTYY